MSDPYYTPQCEGKWHTDLAMAVHLRREHGWTWKKLKEEFTGRGVHFWEEVRWRVNKS